MGYVIGQDNVSNGGASAWGDITGTVANQTDLQSELDGKVDVDGAKVLSANDFTDVLKSKLDNIEANADVTDATNVDSAGAVMNTDTSTASMSFVVDEDDMTSDSATKVPTQQSVKAYVDANAGGGGGTVQDPTTKAIKVAEEVGTTGNARGTNAVDLQVKRSSATQVASGTGSFQAGENCTASGYSSTASGYSSTASGHYSTARGYYSTAYIDGQFSQSSQRIASSGDSQYSFFVVRERTTDATPKVLTLGADGSSIVRAVLPSGKSWRFVIDLVSRDISTGDTFVATYVGAIKRVGSTTSLTGIVAERDKRNDAGASTWSVVVTANDTNESLDITVTGEASKTINWCAVVRLTEVA